MNKGNKLINNTKLIQKSLKKRYKKERNFKLWGIFALLLSFVFLFLLLQDIVKKSIPAFTQYYAILDIDFNKDNLKIDRITPEKINRISYRSLLNKTLQSHFPNVGSRQEKKLLRKLISSNFDTQVKNTLIENPDFLDKVKKVEVLLDDDVDTFIKDGGLDSRQNLNSRIRPNQAKWVKKLNNENRLVKKFNFLFFSNSDSREPELAGIKGAFKGSLLTILVTIILSFPIGLAAAIYLEEFAPKNKFTDFIEININNLAAVPSIVFGLLGLSIFINLFGIPRSAPLVGGLVLSLMTLPTIIISSRAAIKAVPPSLKEAALGLGASHSQTVFHHVLPKSMPGVLTGAIIGIAQAIGETAPLLMIGMVAFIVDTPSNIIDSATVLPIQIYIWADSPEKAFIAKTSAAILVLLIVLMTINILAVFLRKKFENR